MLNALWSVGGFVVTLGLLIAGHEFGHFWVARRLGVRVLRYSIGFGRPLLRWRRQGDPTEYVLAAIPLGGYVKMLDENEGEVPAQEAPQAFNRQALWKRSAIVLAGPLANLLLAVFFYWLMFLVGIPGLRPIVGEVTPDSPAARAGLVSGQELVEVDGREVVTWEEAGLALTEALMSDGSLTLGVRGADNQTRRVELEFGGRTFRLDGPDSTLTWLGIKPFQPALPPVIGELSPGLPAAKAGFQAGDRLLQVDGEPVQSWSEWVERVRASPERPLAVTVERGGQQVVLSITPDRKVTETGVIGFIGAAPQVPDGWFDQYRVVHALGPVPAAQAALAKTASVAALTLKMIGKMVVGEASVKNVSGPIAIAEFAGLSAQGGLARFLAFLALVSVSLGVLNLLPIPVLDGGHLLYHAAEAVLRRPLSDRVREIGQQVGIAMLLGLTLLAIYNDLTRLLP